MIESSAKPSSVTVLIAIAMMAASPTQAQPVVLSLSEHEDAFTRGVLDGFIDRLAGATRDVHHHPLTLSANAGEHLPESIASVRPALILALGRDATDLACRWARGAPVLALVDEPIERVPPDVRLLLATSRVPILDQVRLIRRILPKARRIGVLIRAEGDTDPLAEARATMAASGLVLVEARIQSHRELADAMAAVFAGSDVLLCLPDQRIFNPNTARSFLIASFRTRTPLVGPSAEWVEAGALCSPQWRAADLGARCAELATEMLDNAPTAVPVPPAAYEPTYRLNLETVRKMDLDIADSAVTDALMVYQ